MAIITYREALNQALREEMGRDDRVFLMGEEVGVYNGAYKVSKGLLDEFGEMRVVDTPITELGFAGVGVGAAMVGLRPVIEFMTWNFALLAIDQVVNAAAKMLYMSGGQYPMPMVFRGPNGAALQLSAQHSQAFESWLAHIPGLKVVTPGTPYDAKGLLKAAIRDDNPVIVLEGEMLYNTKGEVPDEDYIVPIGVADLKREGDHCSIITSGKMALVAMQAISDWLIALESVPELQQAARYEADQATLDEHVFNFFDLGATEKELVRETVDKLMPAIRPRGFKRMRELAQLRLAHGDLDAYARTLGRALTEWRERMGGQGQFEVGVMASEPSRAGPLGIVRVRYRPDVTDKPVLDRSQIDDALVLATVAQLREAGLTVIPSGDAMQLVPDTQIWNGGDLYLVRPLARRSWTVRHALRDAEQMVRTVQRVAADPSPSKRVPA